MSRFTSRASTLASTALVIIATSFLLGIAGASAHAHLASAQPRAGSILSTAPHEVSLSFTEGLEQAFSTVEVTDATGARVDQGEAEIKGSTMRVGLKELPAGTYKVNWRALSVDTHKTEGTFSFRVGK
jgi:methionine-rich copper-binding protein CopC